MKKLVYLLLGLTAVAYADNNPYSFFSSGNSGSDATSATTVTAAPTPGTTATTTTSTVANTAPVASPNIQYVQPASQIGNVTTPSTSAMSSSGYNTKGSGSQPALQAFTSGATSLPNTLTNNMSQNSSTLGLGASGGGQNAGLLQQIANNTQGTQNSNNNLLTYWTQVAPNDPLLGTTSGYSSLSGLTQQETSLTTLQRNLGVLNVPTLQAQSQDEGSPNPQKVSIPYLRDLTADTNANSTTWTAAVNQALLDLSASTNAMQNMHQAVMAPFGGQANWLSQVQTASSPQLLRMLVVQQAMQNYMNYVALQRQQDQELMQAATLQLLAQLQDTMNQNTNTLVDQDQELRKSIQILSGKLDNGK